MSRLKQRIARRLHHIAWRLDPLPTSTPLMAYTTDAPMTDATAKVIADAVSGQIGRNIGLHFRKVDGSDVHRY